jgi:MoaA/NifB/PqqE/SkfB family radical SAM enzyme
MRVSKVAQLGLGYAQSLWSYRTGSGPRPFSASFAVTNKCNLQCSYCNCPNLKTPELTLNQIGILFTKLKKMGVIRLGLLGGEPLVRKDIGEVIALARKMNFFISMNTNLLLYKKFESVLEPVDYYFTSLDGSPEKHIANRGNHDYNRVLAAIRSLVDKKKKVTAICVVTDPDFEAVDYLIKLAKKEKIDIHFQPECYDAENTKRSAPSSLDNYAMRNYWKHIKELKSKGAPITSSFAYLNYLIAWQNYAQTSVYDSQIKCAAGLGYIFIDSSGFTYPCPYTKGQVAGVNLLETDWTEGFNARTPCTKCIVGPMLEFNLLFDRPIRSIAGAFNKIV